MMKNYLDNSKAEVTFIEHDDFVLVCTIVKHVTAAYNKPCK